MVTLPAPPGCELSAVSLDHFQPCSMRESSLWARTSKYPNAAAQELLLQT